MPCDLSIVIPAHNEAARLPGTLDAVARHFEGSERDCEVIVVDDASTDATSEVAVRRAPARPRLRVASLPVNRGKGAAVRHGMGLAEGRFRLFMDADLSTPMSCLAVLEAAIADGADIAIGSRAHPGSHIVRRQAAPRQRMGQVFNLVMRALTGLEWADTQCGFKLFTAGALGHILPLARIDGFAFDVEWLVIAREAGLRVADCPVEWRNDERSTVSILRHPCAMLAELWHIRARLRAGGYAPRADSA